jgi:hypothetical protein
MHDWYIFGAWLMRLLMVQVEVQVGAWLMHLFMVQVVWTSYLYMFGAWLMHFFMVHVGTCYWYRLLHVDWYRFTSVYLTVIV